MIKNDAVINIKGTQTIDGEDNLTEIDVVGTIEETDKGYIIEYSDYEMGPAAKTVISVGNNGTVLMAKLGGEFTTEMYFERSTRQNCEYSTPYGLMTVGIYTNEIKVNLHSIGGSVLLDYNIDFNSGAVARNVLDITVNVTKDNIDKEN